MADAKQLMAVADQGEGGLNTCPPKVAMRNAHQRLKHVRKRIRKAGNDQALPAHLADRIWPGQMADVLDDYDDDDKD